MRRFVLVFLAVVCLADLRAEDSSIVWTRRIAGGDGKYIGWPTVTRLRSGEVVAVFSGDRQEHVCPWGKIQIVRSTDGGETWTKPQTIVNDLIDDRDAGLLELPDGKQLLFYDETERQKGSWVRISEDGGKTWGERISTEIQSPHGAIRLRDGRLFMLGLRPDKPKWRYFAVESRNSGKTWSLVTELPMRGIQPHWSLAEPSLFEGLDGTLHGYFRYELGNRHMLYVRSTDGGQTWTEPVVSDLDGFPPHFLRLHDGRVICTYGRRTDGRAGIFARLSSDDGENWGSEVELMRHDNKDLGYPSTAELDDGTLISVFYMHYNGEPKASLVGTKWRVPACTGMSMEAVERRDCLRPGASPMDGKPEMVTMSEEVKPVTAGIGVDIPLDGEWTMASDRSFSDPIPASVPGSVHIDLWKAGRLEDPCFGQNDLIAKQESFREWWFRREFNLSKKDIGNLRLEFDGVCEGCTVWLNGQDLGTHHGMFGGPEFDVSTLVREGKNVLVLRLDRAPCFIPDLRGLIRWRGKYDNEAWRQIVVFNCCYGWHYAQIPARGIWRSIRLRRIPKVKVEDPFVSAVNTAGDVDFWTRVRGENVGPCRLRATVRPKNFKGASGSFVADVTPQAGDGNAVRLRFRVPEAKLWWPNGMGKQNLYTMDVACETVGGEILDTRTFDFGIRTIAMRPAGNGVSSPEKFDWQFVINDRPMFVKGTGWCTMDALMRFDRGRYEHFLSAAKMQNVNFIRAWGCGLVETDEFYDICDRLGICVMQEWPIAWGSYTAQPRDVLLDTVERGVRRLRNRASLIMWCGGNEGLEYLHGPKAPQSTLDLVGRRTIELDGTRPWHRQESNMFGSTHCYAASWGGENPASMMRIEDDFLGEFGVDSFPNVESMRRYVPDSEWLEAMRASGTPDWELPVGGSIAHHTPKFNTADDCTRLQQHVPLFLKPDSLTNVVLGSQIAQAVGVRYAIERARTRFPACGGASMYKLNDVYPAASWSTVDWYGAPKYAHFVVQDAFAPLSAVLVFDALELGGKPLSAPLWILDDADALAGRRWTARVRAYDAQFAVVKQVEASGSGAVGRLKKVDSLELTETETASTPLWFVADLEADGKTVARNVYYHNFEARQGCLFDMPQTELKCSVENGVATISNVGSRPAINVNFDCADVSDRFLPEDSFFWLDPGEVRRIGANDFSGVKGVRAWNARAVGFAVAPIRKPLGM